MGGVFWSRTAGFLVLRVLVSGCSVFGIGVKRSGFGVVFWSRGGVYCCRGVGFLVRVFSVVVLGWCFAVGVECFGVGLLDFLYRGGVFCCVILYFYPATCGPKGHGNGRGCFHIPYFFAPGPAYPVIVGLPPHQQ